MLLGAHLGALVTAIRRRGVGPLAVVNLAVAAFILLFVAWRLRYPPIEPHNLQLAVLELAAIAAAVLAFRGHRAAAWVTGAIFAVHLLAATALTAFAFLFKMTRLF